MPTQSLDRTSTASQPLADEDARGDHDDDAKPAGMIALSSRYRACVC
jgi:hypothetical protein